MFDADGHRIARYPVGEVRCSIKRINDPDIIALSGVDPAFLSNYLMIRIVVENQFLDVSFARMISLSYEIDPAFVDDFEITRRVRLKNGARFPRCANRKFYIVDLLFLDLGVDLCQLFSKLVDCLLDGVNCG